MAFEYMGYSQSISYRGFDKNIYWEKVHQFIENNYQGGHIRFDRDRDVLTYFDEHILRGCNVIVIQYLISFFYYTVGEAGLTNWFAKLAKSIVKNKPQNSPMLIIINDADSKYTGRDAFSLLISEIENEGLEVSNELRRRFKEPDYYENSQRYRSDRNIFENEIPEDFISDYCVAITCTSAQLILEVI